MRPQNKTNESAPQEIKWSGDNSSHSRHRKIIPKFPNWKMDTFWKKYLLHLFWGIFGNSSHFSHFFSAHKVGEEVSCMIFWEFINKLILRFPPDSTILLSGSYKRIYSYLTAAFVNILSLSMEWLIFPSSRGFNTTWNTLLIMSVEVFPEHKRERCTMNMSGTSLSVGYPE